MDCQYLISMLPALVLSCPVPEDIHCVHTLFVLFATLRVRDDFVGLHFNGDESLQLNPFSLFFRRL